MNDYEKYFKNHTKHICVHYATNMTQLKLETVRYISGIIIIISMQQHLMVTITTRVHIIQCQSKNPPLIFF